MRLSKLFWIGLVISSSIIVFVFGLLYLQDISLNKASLRFTVMFDNVQGLNDGDNVSMLGKKIGKVSAAKIMGNRVAVEVSIDQGFSFNIPIDSRIEVKSDGLIGSKFVAIEPGNNLTNNISNGDVVEGKREVDFTEITPGIMPITQDLAVFTRRLKAILGEEQKDDIRMTISNINSLSHELDSIIKDLHSLMSAKEDRKNIGDFFNNLNSASKNINDMTSENKDQISSILNNLSDGSKAFASSAEKIDNMLGKVENGDGSLGELVHSNGLINNMNGFVDDLRGLIEDISDNTEEYFKKYIRANKKVKKEK
tara:strand:+ start:383 stop:1315 length:933 start_codon:yes stop_codon:yes gene_type:complete